jgi:hypothetical protein
MDRVEEVVVDWIQLRAHENYDIQSVYPFLIRKRSNNRIMSLSPSGDGYHTCFIDGRNLKHHRVIAEQFIPNPENLPEIDHINHIGTDNRLQNLRWVSHGENNRNKTAYRGGAVEYLDELPEGSEPIIEVRNRPVANGFYRNGFEFFVEVHGRYRRLRHTRHSRIGWHVRLTTPNGEQVFISWHD